MTSNWTLFEMPVDTEAKAGDTVVNVASVPQRNPFRYPSGKTWAIPVVRKWLQQDGGKIPLLVEPFAGGGIVSLTAAAEGISQTRGNGRIGTGSSCRLENGHRTRSSMVNPANPIL